MPTLNLPLRVEDVAEGAVLIDSDDFVLASDSPDEVAIHVTRGELLALASAANRQAAADNLGEAADAVLKAAGHFMQGDLTEPAKEAPEEALAAFRTPLPAE